MNVQTSTRKIIQEYAVYPGMNTLPLPVGTEILGTAWHNSNMYLCVLAPETSLAQYIQRTFHVLSAWSSAPGLETSRYLGKLKNTSGLMFHAFETTEPHLIQGW